MWNIVIVGNWSKNQHRTDVQVVRWPNVGFKSGFWRQPFRLKTVHWANVSLFGGILRQWCTRLGCLIFMISLIVFRPSRIDFFYLIVRTTTDNACTFYNFNDNSIKYPSTNFQKRVAWWSIMSLCCVAFCKLKHQQSEVYYSTHKKTKLHVWLRHLNRIKSLRSCIFRAKTG